VSMVQQPPHPDESALAECMLALLARRGTTASACPSEVARAWSPDRWRDHMAAVRQVATDLSRQGQLDILQRGETLPPGQPWKGPVRLRLHRPDS
jgi:Protein of unknown function (DUF3253)